MTSCEMAISCTEHFEGLKLTNSILSNVNLKFLFNFFLIGTITCIGFVFSFSFTFVFSSVKLGCLGKKWGKCLECDL